MKLYIKGSRMSYHELQETIRPIGQEISQALRTSTEFSAWPAHSKDNGDGTVRIGFGFGIFDGTPAPSAKEARKAVVDAINQCSPELQSRVVKITCGYDGDRGVTWPVVNVTVRL